MNKWILATLLAIVAMMIAPQLAAHTQLDRAVPAAGSTLSASPPRLTLWFSQRLEPAFSQVQVLDADDNPVDQGDSAVNPDDGKQIEVSLPVLAPGTYKVRWRVLSVDSHVNEDGFTFEVRQ